MNSLFESAIEVEVHLDPKQSNIDFLRRSCHASK
jgi:hypothetical protein